MFIIATIVNNATKVTGVSWNLMVIEDADSEQRKSAFNLLNIINISLGIITPIGGLGSGQMWHCKSRTIFYNICNIKYDSNVLYETVNMSKQRLVNRFLTSIKVLILKNG